MMAEAMEARRLQDHQVSGAKDLEALPSRPRHWAECCHYVEAPCFSIRPITRAQAAIVLCQQI
jgi:hypothetical protein